MMLEGGGSFIGSTQVCYQSHFKSPTWIFEDAISMWRIKPLLIMVWDGTCGHWKGQNNGIFPPIRLISLLHVSKDCTSCLVSNTSINSQMVLLCRCIFSHLKIAYLSLYFLSLNLSRTHTDSSIRGGFLASPSRVIYIFPLATFHSRTPHNHWRAVKRSAPVSTKEHLTPNLLAHCDHC